MRDNWKTYRLEDCMQSIIDYRGKTPKKTKVGIPLITAKIVKDGKILTPTEFIAEKDYGDWMRRGMPKPRDVIMTTEAPLGEIAQLGNEKVALAQRLITLRGKAKILDNDFLKYLMQSKSIQHQLDAHSSGTTVIGIKQSELRKLKLNLPPFPEQKAIARILGSLDNKIDLNRQMNRTLEDMAQAIFKAWFVDFEPFKKGNFVENELGKIPVGWRVGNVGENFDLTMGQSPPGTTYNEEGIGTPFFQGRRDFTNRFPVKRVFCTEPKRFAKKDDSLISVRAPVGDLNMAIEDCCIGRGLAAIRHKSTSRSFTYYSMNYLKNTFNSFEANGTVFGSINKTQFESLKLVIPTNEIIKEFEKTVRPIDELILNNELEIQTLTKTRDTLLPKLVSGEIGV